MQTDVILVKPGDMRTTITSEIESDPRLKSPHTQRGYLHDLVHFETWRAGRPLSRLLVERYAADLQKAGRAAAGINRALAAIRWWARKVGDLAYEGDLPPAAREEIVTQAARVATIADVKGGPRAKAGRHIGYGEIDALLRACANDHTATGARDAAIIALMTAIGARRAELCSLTLADIEITDANAGEGIITIHGKGDKTRQVDLCNGAFAFLKDWLTLRGSAPGPLFYAIRRGGHIVQHEGLSTEALAKMLAKRAQQASLTKRVHWHDFRRTLAGELLDQGADVVTVQKIMGHASPVTTAAYDRRPDDTRRKALRGRHVPYYARTLV